ncbi:translocase [Shimia isoporae]|nr:translocase [Shimia isoporae]
MRNMRNVYRRYSMACATATIAIFIGFVMERTEASQAMVVPQGSLKPAPSLVVPASLGTGALPVEEEAARLPLPPMPKDYSTEIVLPGAPTVVATTDSLPKGLISEQSAAPEGNCEIELRAEAGAGAMVLLSLKAPCLSGERVTIEHGSLVFSELVGEEGVVTRSVPALAVEATFSARFANGQAASVTLEVDSLVFYERTVIRWTGNSGVELHAREFGASYGDDGHVWRGSARDISVLVGGMGGFLTELGDVRLPDAARAEVYTFPSVTAQRSGLISLSVEAEITEANCGKSISVQTERIKDGETVASREMAMDIPGCEAAGQFLVLKNLVEDLTIAQK